MGLISELKEQVKVAKEKDPAALNAFEIIVTYSGVHAIISHRVAHWFYKNKVHFYQGLFLKWQDFLQGLKYILELE